MITIRRHGEGEHIAEIVLDRPAAMNAVSTAFARELSSATAELTDDRGVRVVVVSSSHDKAFCVGADLKERNGFTDADLIAQRPITRAAYTGVLELPMPTIAAVEGYALGGGAEIALSCDIVVAGEAALIGLPEVSVGVIPGGGGTQLLVRRVGWGKAARAIFTAQKFTGAQAHEWGFVEELVAAGDARQRALELATAIAQHSPTGLVNAKRAMRRGSATDLAAGLDIEDGYWRATAFSPDRAEGVRAFAEKRQPRWTQR